MLILIFGYLWLYDTDSTVVILFGVITPGYKGEIDCHYTMGISKYACNVEYSLDTSY